MNGSCLCHRIEFELSGDIPNLYQCHCSLCRKVTGSSANAAFRITAEQFRWLKGQDLVREYIDNSGFKSHFCGNCGSPVPNLTANDQVYWVPVGLLEDSDQLKVVAHLFLGSKASWDVVADVGEHYAEMPGEQELGTLLQRDKLERK